MGKKIYIDITPDKSIMPKLGRSGYSVAEAISELIDNALDAKPSAQRIEVTIDNDTGTILVKDDGGGMDKADAIQALKLAASHKEGALGEFGIGLKAACLSLGATFQVRTHAKGTTEGFTLSFDEREWMKDKKLDWSRFPINTFKAPKKEQGTEIEITHLKVKPRVGRIRDSLAGRYAPFIEHHGLELVVNERACKPEPLEVVERRDIEIKGAKDTVVKGWYGILSDDTGAVRRSGMTLLKRGRVVELDRPFGYDPHPALVRLVGEIHLDHVPWAYTKREFIHTSKEYKQSQNSLSKILGPFVLEMIQESTKVSLSAKERDRIDNWVHACNEILKKGELADLYQEAKRHGFRAADSRDLDSLFVDNQKGKKKPKKSALSKSERQRVKTIHKSGGSKPKDMFVHLLAHLGETGHMKEYFVTPKGGIVISTNVDFPAFQATRDKAFYCAETIADALSHLLAFEGKSIVDVKESILLKALNLG